jgi:hypothetical protein
MTRLWSGWGVQDAGYSSTSTYAYCSQETVGYGALCKTEEDKAL